MSDPRRHRIIHISDPHVWSSEARARSALFRMAKKAGRPGFLGTYQRKDELEAICRSIASQCSPERDVVLLTGDIVEGNFRGKGIKKEYRAARQALRPLIDARFDLHVVPGNHDLGFMGNISRQKARDRFMEFQASVARHGGSRYSTTFPETREYEGWRLLLLNTAGHEGRGKAWARGKFGQDQLNSVEIELENSRKDGKAIVIAFHHHPVMRRWKSQFLLEIVDHEHFLEMLRLERYEGVKKIVCCGHKHVQNLKLLSEGSRHLYAVAAGQCTTEHQAIHFRPTRVWETGDLLPADTIEVRYTANKPGTFVLADPEVQTVRHSFSSDEITLNNRRSMASGCIVEDVQLEQLGRRGVQRQLGRVIQTKPTKVFKRSAGARVIEFQRGTNDLKVKVRTWNDRPERLPFKFRVIYHVRRRSGRSRPCRL
jgi:3',5'-cyclic AMP phosphodiesterase CpdA